MSTTLKLCFNRRPNGEAEAAAEAAAAEAEALAEAGAQEAIADAYTADVVAIHSLVIEKKIPPMALCAGL